MTPSAPARARDLVAGNRFREAYGVLTRAAAAGDPDALGELAHWRIQGGIVRRDLAEARRLFARAAHAGNVAAAVTLGYFAASGIGGDRDWRSATMGIAGVAPAFPPAREQLALLARMDIDPDGVPIRLPPLAVLNTAPRVAAARGFLSGEECAYLTARAEPRFSPSVVVDPASGRLIPNPIRTSQDAAFGVIDTDLAIAAINQRIAALTGTDPAQGEPLQVLRYRPGGEYREHMDALPGTDNQRIVTVLVYLNEDYAGGETDFPALGIRFRGRRGDALVFDNVTADGRADPRMRHAGRPVLSGVKLIASRWIRRAPFIYPPPPPLLADS